MKQKNESNPVYGGENIGISNVQTPEKLPYPAPEPAFVHPHDGQSITRQEPGAVEVNRH